MKKILRISGLLLLAAIVGVGLRYYWGTHLRWNDFKNYTAQPGPIGFSKAVPSSGWESGPKTFEKPFPAPRFAFSAGTAT